MLKTIRNLLDKIVKDIDAGNSTITADEGEKIIRMLNDVNSQRLSKYQACQYLNISRAKFDNLVREGKLPEGIRQAGFKEKFWIKSDIEKFIANVM